MIEKLTPEHYVGLTGFPETRMPDSAKLMSKINELIDAVNSIVSVQEKLIDSRFMVETKHEATTLYAEQKKWMGKLCWFWDEDPKDKIVDILSCIDTSDKYPYVMCDCQFHYKHCEPISPEDDIIFKGE